MYRVLVYNNVTYNNFIIDEFGNVINTKTNKKLKARIAFDGYYCITLPMGKRGKVKSIRLHKAIAETFIPNPHHYKVVHHIDGNKLNCYYTNLEWTTNKQNTQYYLEEQSKITEFYNNRKLTQEDVEFIRCNSGLLSHRIMANMYNVSKTTISNVCNNKCYKEL